MFIALEELESAFEALNRAIEAKPITLRSFTLSGPLIYSKIVARLVSCKW